MSRQDQIGKCATLVYTEDGYTKVKYHQTNVVMFNEEEIILNSGGWHTNTTKTRMNQTSKQYDLGYYIFQKEFTWFVLVDGVTNKFEDGMILKRGISQ